MALRALMLGKKIEQKRNELKELGKIRESFKTREEELEKSIDEAQTPEEQQTVDEEIEKLESEKNENEEAQKKLEEEIRNLEEELRKIDEENGKAERAAVPQAEKRTGGKTEIMIKRGFFAGKTVEERDAFIKDEEVKGFLLRVREMKGQKRGVTGAELTIPESMLELIKDNLNRYSKLIKHVKVKPLKGKARQNIAGVIPEGIWTEAISALNELEISFGQVEMDGYKVGGFISIPNSTLEDSDENLASEIMDALAQAIGLAVDKAIIYGTGKKMPIGIVTRLAQTAQPETWSNKAPKWTDLHKSNVKALNIESLEGAKYFAALIKGLGVAKENYSDGKKVWCMNSTTKTEIMAKAITFNAAGTIVASVNNEMPVIGGVIETFDFMQDGDIVGGYSKLYTLVERKGGEFGVSEHAKFIEEQTLFKGSARYDGMPIIGEGFVAVNTGATEPKTTVAFAGQSTSTDNSSDTTTE